MAKLVWDQTGEKLYETGTKMGVLYLQDTTGAYPKGVAWNGLTGVSESPEGAEETELYADDDKYLGMFSKEKFGATITAYTYPDEFEECDGSAELSPGVTIGQQTRKPFGFAYRTVVGNDTEFDDYGYKIHLVYGAKVSPSSRDYKSINDSPEAVEFSWEVSTTPVTVTGAKNTSTLTIDSKKVSAAALKAIEDVLYGTEEKEARLPLPDEVKSIIDAAE